MIRLNILVTLTVGDCNKELYDGNIVFHKDYAINLMYNNSKQRRNNEKFIYYGSKSLKLDNDDIVAKVDKGLFDLKLISNETFEFFKKYL